MSGPVLPSNPDKSALKVGPHDLVISFGDCEFYAHCSCGHYIGMTKPDVSLDTFQPPLERHVMADHSNCDCEPCS